MLGNTGSVIALLSRRCHFCAKSGGGVSRALVGGGVSEALLSAEPGGRRPAAHRVIAHYILNVSDTQDAPCSFLL